jgi:hypothetical protein
VGANGLKLNQKKSQVILIYRSRAQIPQPELYIGSDAIRVVTSVNNLGFVLNGNLTAVDHSKRVIHVRHPSYIFSLFHFSSTARTVNLIVPLHRSHAMSHSFNVRSGMLWNFLPHSVKALPSLSRFISAVGCLLGRDDFYFHPN